MWETPHHPSGLTQLHLVPTAPHRDIGRKSHESNPAFPLLPLLSDQAVSPDAKLCR